MQCEDIDVEDSSPQLNELDSALNGLGMLANTATVKEEYSGNIKNNYIKLFRMNRRYVSNLSLGIRVRDISSLRSYKPYEYPKERSRTRSENSEAEGVAVLRLVMNGLKIEEVMQLKKAKSLECVAEKSCKNSSENKMSEVEVVSNSIKNLKVQE